MLAWLHDLTGLAGLDGVCYIRIDAWPKDCLPRLTFSRFHPSVTVMEASEGGAVEDRENYNLLTVQHQLPV